MADYLIYGATGYTGELIARQAVARGQRPILAGRNADTVGKLAAELGLPSRNFGLDDANHVAAGLDGVHTLLNCAGPFTRTYQPLVAACLQSKVHYLDITGEIAVFEGIARRSDEASAANILLMPGVGFDVVPTDCLALHLKGRLPTASWLTLGLATSGHLSRGTLTTMAENAGFGGMIRRGGRLERVPAGWKTRTFDFGNGPVATMTIPWGDVATAFYSTGIGNIEVYSAVPRSTRLVAWLLPYLGWLLNTKTVQKALQKKIQSGQPGPDQAQRAQGWTRVWGEVRDDTGRSAVSRLSGPEGYTFTVRAALAIVERVLRGQAPAGFHTPAAAYGADLVLQVEGVTRQDD